jgi:protein involved in polysaccharide export with SLBB domain
VTHFNHSWRLTFAVPLLGAAIFLLNGCMSGGSAPTAADQATTQSAGQNAQSYTSNPRADIIRTGDTLVLRVSGVPEGEGGVYEEPVSEDGAISMPLVGSFRAAGKSTSALKAEIEAAYRDKKIYATPSVTIVQQARFVNVIGEVRSPQRVPYTSDLTMLKVISACGGFTDYANRGSVKILRGPKVITFNATQALENPSKDLPLQAGDQIQVPRTIF